MLLASRLLLAPSHCCHVPEVVGTVAGVLTAAILVLAVAGIHIVASVLAVDGGWVSFFSSKNYPWEVSFISHRLWFNPLSQAKIMEDIIMPFLPCLDPFMTVSFLQF
jgi:hypothetical protein